MFKRRLAIILAAAMVFTSTPVYAAPSANDTIIDELEEETQEESESLSDASEEELIEEEETEETEETEQSIEAEGDGEETPSTIHTGMVGTGYNNKLSDDIIWTLDEETGVLTLSGTGRMFFQGGSGYGYYPYRKLIKSVVVEDGITEISTSAFISYSNIVSVSIGNTVERIDDYAFEYTDKLTHIELPESVKYLGENAFAKSSNSYSADVIINNPNCSFYMKNSTVSTGSDGAIYGHKGSTAQIYAMSFGKKFIPLDEEEEEAEVLTGSCCVGISWSLDVGTGKLSFIGSGGLDGMLGSDNRYVWNRGELGGLVKSVEVQEGITSLPRYALRGLKNLTSVSLPSTVESIGEYAFYECSSLESVTLPENITAIPKYCFGECKALSRVNLADLNLISIGEYAFFNCPIHDIPLNETLNTIGARAFSGNTSVEEVILPSGVKEIPSYLFTGCTNLKRVEMGDEVRSIGSYAFSSCTSLCDISIPQTVRSIGSFAFSKCSSVEAFVIPSGVTSIGTSAFNECLSAKTIEIPDTVTSIAYAAFNDCVSITEINIPDGVSTIPDYMLSGCLALKKIELPDSVVSIGQYSFSHCEAITEISIPEGVEILNSWSLGYCTNLETVRLPEGLKQINANVFVSCPKLKSLSCPESLTNIYHPNFTGCSSFADIYLPSDSCTLGRYSSDYSVPRNVVIHGKVASPASKYAYDYGNLFYDIETGMPAGRFWNTSAESYWEYNAAEKELLVKGTGRTYSTSYKITNTDNNMYVRFRPEVEKITIDDGIETIGKNCFYSFDKVASVSIPSSVKTIEGMAFSNCSGLEDIYIYSRDCDFDLLLKNYDSNIFPMNPGLTLHVFKNSTAEDYAVAYGYNYEVMDPETEDDGIIRGKWTRTITWELTEESGVLTIDGPEKSYIPGNNDSTYGSPSWRNINDKIKSVVVSEGICSIGRYSLYSMPEVTDVLIKGAASIEEYAFSSCAKLKRVSINDSCTYIGRGGFNSCASLTDINIPAGLTSFSDYMFQNCRSLTGIEIPSGIKTIGSGVFAYCSAFTEFTLPETVESISSSVFGGCINLAEVIVPNKDIEITGSSVLVPNGVVVGHEGSTAQTNAASYRGIFKSIETGIITGSIIGKSSVILPFTVEDGKLTISGTGSIADLSYYSSTDTYEHSSDKLKVLRDDITEIEICDGINTIGAGAFENYPSLESVTIAPSVTAISYGAFRNCDNLGQISILGPTTDIYDRSGHQGETIPEGAIILGYESSKAKIYADNNNRKFIEIGDGCSGVAGSRVIWTYYPEEHTLSISGRGDMYSYDGTRTVPWSDFAGDIKNIDVAAEITYIGKHAFSMCSNLEKITVFNKTCEIPGEANEFTEGAIISAPSGSYAHFYALDNGYEFNAIDEGTIGGSCGEHLQWSFDVDTRALIISGSGDMYDYSRAGETPWSYLAPYAVRLYVKPDTRSIGDYAFYNMYRLKTVELPDTLERIGVKAFAYCNSIRGMSIPASVTTVGADAFVGTAGFGTANLPDSIGGAGAAGGGVLTKTDIVPYIFAEEIVVPVSVTEIDQEAFSECRSLKTLTILNPECVIFDAETTVYSNATIKGYADSTAQEYALKYGRNFIAIGGGKAGIAGRKVTWHIDTEERTLYIEGSGDMYSFNSSRIAPWGKYAEEIAFIDVADSVGSIGSGSFTMCTNLESITIHGRDTVFDGGSHFASGTITIKGYTDSEAKLYAAERRINFTALDDGYIRGEFAEGLTFSFDFDAGELTVSGNGMMNDCSEDSPSPWNRYAKYVRNVYVGDGITYIGNVFGDCINLAIITVGGEHGCFADSPDAVVQRAVIRGYKDSPARDYAEKYMREFVSLDDKFMLGKCGEKLLWSVDLESGVLTIWGEGDMYNYTQYTHAPWYQYRADIRTLYVLENTVSIGNYAFAYLTRLVKVELPDTLERIGMYAFGGCTSVKGLVIPDSVKKIETGALDDVKEIAEIVLPDDIADDKSDDGEGSDDDQKGVLTQEDLDFYRFATEIVVPASVRIIAEGAFSNCTRLESIKILNPDCVIFDAENTIAARAVIKGYTDSTAQEYAIKYNRAFESIDNLFHAGKCGPTLYWRLDIRDGELIIWGSGQMYNYSAESPAPWNEYKEYIIKITLEKEETSVGSYAFAGCENITEIAVPDKVTSIGDYAFMNCRKLAAVRLPSGLKNLGKGAFMYCVSLVVITIPEGVREIKENTFYNCDRLEKVTANKVDKVDNGAFSNCRRLTTPSIPSTAAVSTNAFEGCDTIRAINRLADIEEVKDETFLGCESLEVILIPETVKKLGKQALALCTKLRTVTIKNKSCDIYDAADTIYETATIYGHYGSTAQKYAEKYGRSFVALDGSYASGVADEFKWSLIKKNGVLTIIGDGEMPGFASPAAVPWADYMCDVKSVVFEGNITSIGSYAFYNADHLEKVVIPDTVRSIGDNAFAQSDILKEIEIPDGVLSISPSAFSGCKTMESLEKTKEIDTVDAATFADERETIKVIYLDKNIKTISENAFSGYVWLQKITIANKDCDIFDSADTIYRKAVIYGCMNSTAQAYAENYDRTFIAIDAPASEPDDDGDDDGDHSDDGGDSDDGDHSDDGGDSDDGDHSDDGGDNDDGDHSDDDGGDSAENPFNTGDPVIDVTDEDSEQGTLSVSLKSTSFTYTGAPIKPAATVKYTYKEYDNSGDRNGREKTILLKENTDYVLMYENNIDAGTGKAIVRFIGDYTGKITKEFTIGKKSMRSIVVDSIEDMAYTGEDLTEEIESSVVVRDGSRILDENDYVVNITQESELQGDHISGADNSVLSAGGKHIGRPDKDTSVTVTITPASDGNYSGLPTKGKTDFTIVAHMEERTDLSDAEITLKSSKVLTYSGKAIKPKVSVKIDGNTVSAKNYKLVYVDNVNAGEAGVYAVGKKGCFGKSKVLSFTINKKNFKSVKIAKLKSMAYRTHLENLNPKVTAGKTVLEKNADYSILAEPYSESSFGNKKNIKVKLTFTPLETSENFTGDAKVIKVTLTKRSIANKLTTRVVDEDGSTAVYYNGVKLTENTDYTVAVKRNGDRIVTGCGIYTGKRLLK